MAESRKMVDDEKRRTACFSVLTTEAGQKILAYLKERTSKVKFPHQATTEELWFAEGQRAVVAEMEYLAKRSMKNG